jgi:hypothetical protein
MHQDGCARCSLQFFDTAYVVNMSVRRQNIFGLQFVPRKDFLDSLDLVAGIDDYGFTARFIAEDRAVTLQHADRENFMDHTVLSFIFFMFAAILSGAWRNKLLDLRLNGPLKLLRLTCRLPAPYTGFRVSLDTEMNLVVVGGHTRNIGKTSVMVGLIHDLQSLGWTAVKITQYGHGICSRDGQPCGCAPTEHPFMLTEEVDPGGRTDTSRFLAAGARRALWLRARQGQLNQALPLLTEALSQNHWVMMESNSILEFMQPSLYLAVLDNSRPDFKPSAKLFLDRADALVTVQTRIEDRAWPGVHVHSPVPVFTVAAGKFSSPDLCRFVRQKLALTTEHVLSPAS